MKESPCKGATTQIPLPESWGADPVGLKDRSLQPPKYLLCGETLDSGGDEKEPWMFMSVFLQHLGD